MAAIDGSKFKAVNTGDKNCTPNKLKKRLEQVEESIKRYLQALDAADREENEVAEAKSVRLKEKIATLKSRSNGSRRWRWRCSQPPTSRSL